MVTVLYESDDFYVAAQDFDTSFCFMTFTTFEFFSKSGEMFWGERLFRLLKFSQICIANKRPIYYPPEEMKLVASICADFTKNRRVITFGVSMGGYGALKYSRALNASTVIAISPQWSINPVDVGDFDKTNIQYFSEVLGNGAKITEEDCSGSMYLLYDSLHRADLFHAKKILGIPNMFSAPAPFTEHDTIIQLSDTKGLLTLLKMAAEDRMARPAVRTLLRETRSDCLLYFYVTIERLLNRYVVRRDCTSLLEKAFARNAALEIQVALYRAAFEFVQGNNGRAADIIAALSDENLSSFDFRRPLNLFNDLNFFAGQKRLLPLVRVAFPDLTNYRVHVARQMIDLGLRDMARDELHALAALPDAYFNSTSLIVNFLVLGDAKAAYDVLQARLAHPEFEKRGPEALIETICAFVPEFAKYGFHDYAVRILEANAHMAALPAADAGLRRENLDRVVDTHLALGNVEGAMATLRSIIADNPHGSSARLRLATLLINQGRDEFHRSLPPAGESRSAVFWDGAAAMWETLGDKESAIAALTNALAEGGYDLVCRRHMANLLAAQGRTKEAADQLRLIMSTLHPIDPDYIRSLCEIAEYCADTELSLNLAEAQWQAAPLDAASIMYFASRLGGTPNGVARGRDLLSELIRRIEAGYMPAIDPSAPHKNLKALCEQVTARTSVFSREVETISRLFASSPMAGLNA